MLMLGLGAPRPAAALDRHAVDLGVFGGYAWLSSNSELGNSYYRYDLPSNAPLAGIRVAYSLTRILAIEGEARVAFANYRQGGESATVLGGRLHGLVTLPTDWKVQPFLLAGVGSEMLLATSKPYVDTYDIDPLVDLGAGVRVGLGDHLGVRLDLRAHPIRDRQQKLTLSEEVYLGLAWQFGGQPLDTDGDGIVDRLDKCPLLAENKNNFEDFDGCPDNPDSDGDGILDSVDKCPQVAENKNGYQDEDGCPDEWPDSDGDGIADNVDKCPQVAETKNGYQDEDGCPDEWPDTDKDGITDNLDKCPLQPETKNGYEDDDGCPDQIPEKLKPFAGAIRGIQFEVDSARIAAKSHNLLDKAVAILKEFATLRIEISGHTDSSGDADHNQVLSKDRANSVKLYLEERGVQSARLTALGYGIERPVATNKTKAGKALNRRIEFKLMAQ